MLPTGFFNALLFSTLGTDCWSAYEWVFVDIFRFDIVNKLVTDFKHSNITSLSLCLKAKRERKKHFWKYSASVT